MRSRTLAAVVVLATACASASGRGGPARPTAGEFVYRGYAATYPTGLRLAVIQTAEVGRSTVTISYATGEADDPPGKEGLARLAAELTASSASRGGVTLSERAFAAGALATTDVRGDEVVFRAATRQAQLGEVIGIEADRLREPLSGVDARRFESTREALARQVAEELERDGGEALQRRTVLGLALAGTRYGGPPPTPASIRALALDDVRAWAAEHLAPSRAILVVTGPEAPPAVAQGVLAVFGELATTGYPGEPRIAPVIRPAALTRAEPPTPPAPLRLPGAAPRLWIAWRLPGDAAGLTASARYARWALELRVRAALLERALRERVLDLDVELEPGLDASAAVVRVDLRGDADAAPVREALLRAADARTEHSAAALSWIGAAVEEPGDVRFWDLERGIATDAPRLVRATGHVDPVAEVQAQERAQLGEPFRAFYERHVRPDSARTLVVGARVDVPEEPATPDPVRIVSRISDLEAAAPGPDRVRALVEPPGISGAVRRRLANGLEVIVVPRGALPIVEARLLVDADLPDGPAAMVMPALALALSKKTWSLTGSFGCSASRFEPAGGKLAFFERGRSAHLPDMLGRLACWTHRTVDASLFDEAIATLRRRKEPRRSTAEVRAASALLRAAYVDPRRAPPDDAELGKLTAGDARRWLEHELRPERALLVVAGKVDPTPELFEKIEEHFGRWRPGAPRPSGPPPPSPAARRVLLVDAPGAAQAAIGVALRVPIPADRDDAASRVLSYLLFQRLHAELMPLHAGVATSFAGWLDAPVLSVWIQVDRAGAAEAVRRTLAVAERLAAAPPRETETTLARWFAAREEAYRFDTVAGTTAALEQTFFERRRLEAWDALPGALAAVDPARVHAVARSAGIGREAVAVLGDATALAPALRAAGLEPEIVSAPTAPEPARR